MAQINAKAIQQKACQGRSSCSGTRAFAAPCCSTSDLHTTSKKLVMEYPSRRKMLPLAQTRCRELVLVSRCALCHLEVSLRPCRLLETSPRAANAGGSRDGAPGLTRRGDDTSSSSAEDLRRNMGSVHRITFDPISFRTWCHNMYVAVCAANETCSILCVQSKTSKMPHLVNCSSTQHASGTIWTHLQKGSREEMICCRHPLVGHSSWKGGKPCVLTSRFSRNGPSSEIWKLSCQPGIVLCWRRRKRQMTVSRIHPGSNNLGHARLSLSLTHLGCMTPRAEVIRQQLEATRDGLVKTPATKGVPGSPPGQGQTLNTATKPRRLSVDILPELENAVSAKRATSPMC